MALLLFQDPEAPRMKKLTLKNRSQTNATLLSNDFIDHYMVPANGEFVKIYLLLLRHLDNPCMDLTVGRFADLLQVTEGDVLRAFCYWEEQGLLAIDRDSKGNATGLTVEKNPVLDQAPRSARSTKSTQRTFGGPGEGKPGQRTPRTIPLDSFKAQKDLKNLYMIAEQYLGRTLNPTDMDTIAFFYEELGLSADVIDYLLGTCVENGHKSLHYIRAVALSWSERGIATVEEAKACEALYHKDAYTVFNAFGIKGRCPTEGEMDFIRRWTQTYGFTSEIVKEACSRTIAATHQPSFEYADKILTSWLEQGVKHLEDIRALDEAFQKSKAEKQRLSGANPSASRTASRNLNNFTRRSYDMEDLEEQLLRSN